MDPYGLALVCSLFGMRYFSPAISSLALCSIIRLFCVRGLRENPYPLHFTDLLILHKPPV